MIPLVHVLMCVFCTVALRSDKLLELALSFHSVSPRDHTEVVTIGGKHLHPPDVSPQARETKVQCEALGSIPVKDRCLSRT